MKHYRFKDLGITSTKKPFSTHLWWVHSTYGIFMVDSTNQAVLLHSTKARLLVDGSDWSTVDLSDNTNSYKIQAGWLDGNDLWLVMCDNDGTADDFEVCFIEFDDSNDCNPIAVSAGADVNTVYAFDIFKIGTDHFVINKETRAGALTLVCWDVDAAFVEKDTFTEDADFTDNDGFYFGIVTGTKYYSFMSYQNNLGPILYVQYDNSIPAFIIPVVAGIGDYRGPTDKNMRGVSYDGSDLLIFVGKQNADGKNYLITYIVSTSVSIIGAEYNVALQIDRNNAGTVPNELEKGFGVANEIVYEIKARRGGIRQLQNLSAQLSGNIVAITDNFLFAINSGGGWDVYEFLDVTSEISTILYNDGIIGILKKGTFTVHPDFHINWSKGDSIKIYDQYDQLEFHGLINDKNRNRRGIYVYKIDSFTNEIYRKTYSTTYSGDDLDTKQKDIIDNACDFCYRSSSIVGTTTTFNYVYNRAIIYLFWLGRRLERQVPYIEPDGKIWTKAHDGLVANVMIYPGTYINNPTVGLTGTDIDFVDIVSTPANTVIIASLGSHRKVLKQSGNTDSFYHAFTPDTAGVKEYWFYTNDGTQRTDIYFIDDTTVCIQMVQGASAANKFQYFLGGWQDITDCVDATFYHIKVQWYVDNTWDCWVNGVKYVNGVALLNNMVSGIDRYRMRTYGTVLSYLNAWGEPNTDPAYNVGDNEVAWDINNHWQDVQFIDIPGVEETIQGFFDGNSGITRNTVRYRDNTPTIRPEEAIRDPIEQLKGILPLNEFRDPKIEESTEADQLGDNRYAIWSADTLFLGLRVLGQGYLQSGKTIHVENTGQITVAESHLLLLSFVRDPKNDVYSQMILSDNIILPSEFTNLADTSPQQTHTSIVQSFENQADIIAHLTPEGGLALRLTNKTGGVSVKGTIVEAHAATDNAFRVCDANSVESFGVVYEDGVADGSECLIVIGGRVQVLLKDATASTRNNWVQTSDVEGRADATNASPAAAPTHFKEIGHAIESKGADTDVLAYIILHFL